MKFLVSVLYMVGLWLLSSATVQAYCLQNWACFHIEYRTDGVDVVLENKQAHVITSTIMLKTKGLATNVSQSNEYEVSEVLQGFEKRKVLSLNASSTNFHVKDSDFSWAPGNMHAKHNDKHVYRLPFAEHQKYPLVQGFNGGWSHYGRSKYAFDFAMPVGTPVHAARGGTVIDITSHNTRGGPHRRYARYANFVSVLHSDDTTGEYYHLKQHGVAVNVGQTVKAGELLGYSGNTGFSSLPHLHFAVYRAQKRGGFESIKIHFDRPLRQPSW